MKPQWGDTCLLRCGEDSEVVGVVDFTPRVSVVIDLWPATKNYRRITLPHDAANDDYRTELWGRLLTTRGPRLLKRDDARGINSHKNRI